MSNSLNISPVNFDKRPDYLFAGTADVYIKILDDPSWTEFKPLGYTQTEKTYNIEQSYIEYESGFPKETIAKVVSKVKRNFECKVDQLQPEIISLISGGIISSDATNSYISYGSTLPDNLEIAIIVSGKTYNGKKLELYFRRCVPSSETIKLVMGADGFASLDFKAEVLVDDDPLTNNFTWYCNGAVATTADTTSASAVITVTSATGLVVGQYAYGAGIPVNTKIASIDTLSVTLDKNCTATATDTAVKFIAEADIVKSDIAFWLSEN